VAAADDCEFADPKEAQNQKARLRTNGKRDELKKKRKNLAP